MADCLLTPCAGIDAGAARNRATRTARRNAGRRGSAKVRSSITPRRASHRSVAQPCAYCTDRRFFEVAAFFGSVSESTPFSYFASASASFTGQASVKLRLA